MSITDLRSSSRSARADQSGRATRGPFIRIIAGSLALGAVSAAILTLGAFPGAAEHVTTGLALLAVATGGAMLANPQREQRLLMERLEWSCSTRGGRSSSRSCPGSPRGTRR